MNYATLAGLGATHTPLRSSLRSTQLLIQDVGLDSLSLATLVMEGALGKDGADPSITEAFHW